MFGNVTNAMRADWAETALEAFMALGGTDECDGIPDLVTNLMHLQRRRDQANGKAFDATAWATARAAMHDMEHEEDEEGDNEGDCAHNWKENEVGIYVCTKCDVERDQA